MRIAMDHELHDDRDSGRDHVLDLFHGHVFANGQLQMRKVRGMNEEKYLLEWQAKKVHVLLP